MDTLPHWKMNHWKMNLKYFHYAIQIWINSYGWYLQAIQMFMFCMNVAVYDNGTIITAWLCEAVEYFFH